VQWLALQLFRSVDNACGKIAPTPSFSFIAPQQSTLFGDSAATAA
jgi:hypothetical protein